MLPVVELCTDIEGTWYNSCNDMVTLTKTSTGMVLGQYATYADRTAGYLGKIIEWS